jgi:hypothetical protein
MPFILQNNIGPNQQLGTIENDQLASGLFFKARKKRLL